MSKGRSRLKHACAHKTGRTGIGRVLGRAGGLEPRKYWSMDSNELRTRKGIQYLQPEPAPMQKSPPFLQYIEKGRAWHHGSHLQSQHSGGWGTWGQSELQCEFHWEKCETLSPKDKKKEIKQYKLTTWKVKVAGLGIQCHPRWCTEFRPSWTT